MRVRIRRTRMGFWMVIPDGRSMGKSRRTFAEAVTLSWKMFRIRAIERLMREVTEVPHEWHGIPASLLAGASHDRKLHTLLEAAWYRGFSVATAWDDDADGCRDYYVRFVSQRPTKRGYHG